MGVFGGVKSLSILCSLVRNKLMAIWVGPVGVGLVILYNSVTDLVSVTSRLSMNDSSLPEVARADNDNAAHISVIVRRWMVGAGLAGAVLMCLFSPVLSLLSFDDTSHWPQFCLLASIPVLYASALSYQTVLQGRGHLDRLARANLWTALSGIAVSVPLIWWLREQSIVWVILSYGVCMFVSTYFLRERMPRVKVSWAETYRKGSAFARLGMFMTLGIGMGYLTNYLFVLFVNSYSDTSELGIYQAGYTIVNSYVGVIFSGIILESFPKISALVHSRRRMSLVVSHRIGTLAWVIIPFVGLFMACDELIVRIVYAEAFLEMIPFITIAIAAVGMRMASNFLAQVILARGDGHIYFITETLSYISCLVLNIAGYSLAGFYGLGVSYILWYIIYLAITGFVFYRVYGYYLSGRVMVPVIAGAVFAVIAAAGRLAVGWWVPLLMTLAVLPAAYKKLSKN